MYCNVRMEKLHLKHGDIFEHFELLYNRTTSHTFNTLKAHHLYVLLLNFANNVT